MDYGEEFHANLKNWCDENHPGSRRTVDYDQGCNHYKIFIETDELLDAVHMKLTFNLPLRDYFEPDDQDDADGITLSSMWANQQP